MKRFSAVIMVGVHVLALVAPGVTPGAARAQDSGDTAPLGVAAQSLDVAEALGIPRPQGMSATEASLHVAQQVQQGVASGEVVLPPPRSAGLPSIMAASAPFSAAVMTTLGTPFNQVSLLGDWDGREDLAADREGKVDDFSLKFQSTFPGFALTRAAVSAHARANGFNENVYYYGDSLGNVYVAQSPTLGTIGTPLPPGGLAGANIFAINLPTVLNAFGTLNSDDQIVITGICVSPVADLTSFANVNGAFAPFAGQVGEMLYVTFWDTGSGLRLATNNQVVRSGLLAFPIADVVSLPAAPPAIQSPAGFPVTVGGAFGVSFSVFGNLAGCAVDDDGNVYTQQVDLIQFTGANIVKVTDIGANQDRSLAVSGILTITTLNPAGGLYGTTSGPATQVNRFTNYSGTSTLFGNVVGLAAGPGNALYAAVARSADPADPASGLFANPGALGPTPSMIISFADAVGTVSPAAGVTVADGFADVAAAGLTLAPGVNNFRAFALGTGPDRRGTGPAGVFGTSFDTPKLDFQVDYTIYSGLTVDEERKVYVVSGGTPAGLGRDPSPTLGEILVFPDKSPPDRRADFVDLRGDQLPSPPASGGNVGDGDSDRFDHIFWQAPLDQVAATPAGIAGLARGFLRYLNRTAPNAIAGLPNGLPQGDDATSGPLFFDLFDPSHQVAGGDDQNPPFRGDDSDGGGFPPIGDALNGGFEFTFGGSVGGVCTTPWNAFFLNSNGSVTFSAGDIDNSPTSAEFLTGLPKIAGAWTDLNPASRASFFNTFPVQALGFAGINHFKARWINVPEFGLEGTGLSNTFSISLYDDGAGFDENANQTLDPADPTGDNVDPAFDLQEGPTDLRFVFDGASLVGQNPRLDGTGPFSVEYGRMDPQGSAGSPVLVGYSIGAQGPGAAGEVNLSEAGRTGIIGTGVEVAVFELFNAGDFDLRFEGSDTALSTPAALPDLNREFLRFFGRSCAPPPVAAGPPSLTLQLNQSNLHLSQSPNLIVTATLTPGSTPIFVDAFLVVRLPDGSFFSLQANGPPVPGIVPVATGFIPVQFTGIIISAPLGGGVPHGNFTFFSALTVSGTSIVLGIDQDPFTIGP